MGYIKLAYKLYVLLINVIKRILGLDIETQRKLFVEKGTEMYNGKYDYTSVDFNGLDKSVRLHCKLHGRFVVDPAVDHILPTVRRECPICTYKKIKW